MDGQSKIVVVAAGYAHTTAVGTSGDLWTWGDGGCGQLGLGDTEDRQTPTRVGAGDPFGRYKARLPACGGLHTLVVTEAGELWVRGAGVDGRLDLNDATRITGWY